MFFLGYMLYLQKENKTKTESEREKKKADGVYVKEVHLKVGVESEQEKGTERKK